MSVMRTPSRPRVACRAIAVQLASGDLGVDDRGDAGGERGPAASVDVGRRSPRAARRRGTPGRGARCRPPAGRRAAARRRGSSPSAARARRGPGARPPGRPRRRRTPRCSSARLLARAWWPLMCCDEHRMDARRLVEVPAGRQPAVAEHLRVHADGPDPWPSGVRSAASAIRPTRSCDRRHARIAHVDGGELGAGEGQVVMGIDEAGHDRAAGNVDSPAVRRGGGQGGVVVADGDDPVADDRDRRP